MPKKRSSSLRSSFKVGGWGKKVSWVRVERKTEQRGISYPSIDLGAITCALFVHDNPSTLASIDGGPPISILGTRGST